MRLTALALCAFLFAGAAIAAPFADVPANHWAYAAIQKCVDANILQGYDGKFHGKKLLNRYQVAVIVAKILDTVKGGMPAGAAVKGDDVRNIEALTIEFADELALLNVKVSTLEDSFVELKNDVAKLQAAGPAVAHKHNVGGFGLQGFASFGLMMTEEDGSNASLTPGRNLNTVADSTYFTDPMVALAITKDLGEGVVFNLRLVHESDLGAGTGTQAAIDQAYFQVDELLGESIGGKVGAFTFEKMSLETNGAFATPDYTITESFLNRALRTYHAYGVEFAKNEKKMAADDIEINFAVLSGTDGMAQFDPLNMSFNQTGALDNTVEADDSFGYYLFVNKKRNDSPLGWNFFYFNNGSDPNGSTGPAEELTLMQVGLDYAKDDLHVLFQYMDGESEAALGTADLKQMFLLVNYKLDEKQSLSFRYETAELDAGPASDEFDAMTFAWNRQITDNSMLQFEYMMVDDDEAYYPTDRDDDVIQLRYKVWF